MGSLLVWSQQCAFWDFNSPTQCDPLDKFDNDLIEVVEGWLSEGNQLCIGIDMNQHITDSQLAR